VRGQLIEGPLDVSGVSNYEPYREKATLSGLAAWSQQRFGVAFSAAGDRKRDCARMKCPKELAKVVRAIRRVCLPFENAEESGV